MSDGIWTYQWDGENRLVAMQLNPGMGTYLLGQGAQWLRLEFAYDAQGRRISKRLLRSDDNLSTVEIGQATFDFKASYWKKFVYDGWNLSTVLACNSETGEFDSTSVDQTFAWGPDLSGTEQGAGGIGGLAIYRDDGYDLNNSSTAIGPMFPVYDGNGNVTRLYSGVLDSNNDPIRKAEYRYGPFGEDRGRVGPQASRMPFRWSTKWCDNETGLCYYGYRYYSPALGRMLGRDPSGEQSHSNVYAAFANSAPNMIDPLGLTQQYAGPPGGLNAGACDVCDEDYFDPSLLPHKSKIRWQQDTREAAGINERLWAMLQRDAPAITAVELAKVYTHYAVLAATDSRFVWAGAASRVGMQVIPGVLRMDAALAALAGAGTGAGMQNSIWRTRVNMVSIAKDIFDDLAWQHHVFHDYGIVELRAHVDNHDIDPRTFFDGWCWIALGGQQNIMRGTAGILKREQYDIVQPYMERIQREGVLIPWMLNLLVAPVIPEAPGFHGDIFNVDQRYNWEVGVVRTWGSLDSVDRGLYLMESISYYQSHQFFYDAFPWEQR